MGTLPGGVPSPLYKIMKAMCPPSYYHNVFVATHALVHHVPKCMSCNKAVVVIMDRAHCFHNFILCLSSFCEIWALCRVSLMATYIYIEYGGKLLKSVRQKQNSEQHLIIIKAHTGLIEKNVKYHRNVFTNIMTNTVIMGLMIGNSH